MNPDQGDLMQSYDLCMPQVGMHIVCRHTCKQNTHPHKIKPKNNTFLKCYWRSWKILQLYTWNNFFLTIKLLSSILSMCGTWVAICRHVCRWVYLCTCMGRPGKNANFLFYHFFARDRKSWGRLVVSIHQSPPLKAVRLQVCTKLFLLLCKCCGFELRYSKSSCMPSALMLWASP